MPRQTRAISRTDRLPSGVNQQEAGQWVRRRPADASTGNRPEPGRGALGWRAAHRAPRSGSEGAPRVWEAHDPTREFKSSRICDNWWPKSQEGCGPLVGLRPSLHYMWLKPPLEHLTATGGKIVNKRSLK